MNVKISFWGMRTLRSTYEDAQNCGGMGYSQGNLML